MLARPFITEVFIHTDDSRKLEELGIEYNIATCDTREMTFLNIEAISPFTEHDNNYCAIHANADVWITPYSYDHVSRCIAVTALSIKQVDSTPHSRL